MSRNENVVPLRQEFPVLKFHPLADVLPLMEGPEYEDLVASIRMNGQRDDIVTYEGMILDGRNRYRASCDSYRQTGNLPKVKTLEEVAGAGTDPRKYVADKNLLRRHLTVAQRAMYMAQLATYESGYPKSRTFSSGIENTKETDGGSKEPPCSAAPPVLTNAEAGAMANVSAASIKDAKTILSKGTEEERQRVLNDEVGLRSTAAEIRARQPGYVAPSAPVMPGLPNNRLTVPDGKTPSEWCLEGIALEDEGMRGEEAAKSIGMSIQTYREIRDIVLLATRCDLRAEDQEQAKAALEFLDTTRVLLRSYEMVRPIAERFWGARGQRRGGENKRLEDFQTAISLIVSALTKARELSLPYLSEQQASEIAQQLREARPGVTDLIKRIEDGTND